LSLGTKKFGVAFGHPPKYFGVVIAPTISIHKKGSDLTGFLLAGKARPTYLKGFNFSFTDLALKEQGASFCVANAAGISEGISVSLFNSVQKGKGLCISPIWSHANYAGFSFSIFNNTTTTGLKIAPLYAGQGATGIVLAPIASGTTVGLRIAPVNIHYYHRGVLLGLINISGKYYKPGNITGGTLGLEVGIMNISYSSKGMQIGIFNASKELYRGRIRQIGILNFNQVGQGNLQIGIINNNKVGLKVKQFGIINIQHTNKGFRKVVPLYNITQI